jgi:RNA polymerase sigma-70 factor (TIGR02960 family)
MDEDAFRGMVDGFRGELHAHCYRMLGSVHDAEDALQETLLRAWRSIDRFEGRSSLRSWLYTIATNACLNQIARRPRRDLPVDLGPAGVPLAEAAAWLEPYPDGDVGGPEAPEARYELRESVELAFVAAMQHLPAKQRAVLLLRDVLGFSAREVAESLDTTVASANSALQRARQAVDQRLPAKSQQETLRSLDDDELRSVVDQYVEAWQSGDVDAIVAMLAEDAKFAMPPEPMWYKGREAIRKMLPDGPLTVRWRVLPVRANGQLAFGTYGWDAAESAYLPVGIDVITLRGTRIAEITAFLTPRLCMDCGLPDRIDP